MSFLTSPKKTQAKQQPAITGISVQTSVYGKVIAWAFGTVRLAGNLLWYGDFTSYANKQSAHAGKGGGQSSGSVTYTYKTALLWGLCEGPVVDIPRWFVNKTPMALSSRANVAFLGNYGQAPWAYLTSKHPDQALGYSGIACVGNASLSLGDNPNLVAFNFEVKAWHSQSVAGQMDADASLVVASILSDPHCGAGFPAARVGDLSTYQAYTLSAGLLLSFVLGDQADAASVLKNIADCTNSEFVLSQGLLTLVPYGDTAISGNGASYTPPSSPLYDLTDDDFVPQTDTDPVALTRKRPSDAYNSMQMEYTDRTNSYNTAVVEAKDQAAIDLYGLRQSTSSNAQLFALAAAAQQSIQLQLQRQAVRNQYTFTLDERYVLLDPMDIVTLTDAGLGLNRQWVRIIDITENDDHTLTFTAEEYLAGTGHAATYSFATGAGYQANANIDPGDANPPVIFDAPVQIATTSGLEVWMVASGGPDWGGCDVWISSDGETYKQAGDRILGSARQGIVATTLPYAADPDTTNTLSVDLTMSGSELSSGTQNDADQANTLCYVDGELIAYESATLTGVNTFDLTYLRRGLYGTASGSHGPGSQFARLDSGVFVYSYDKSQIGQTIYVKLLSFNIYQGAQQTLADVDPIVHVIQGPPPPGRVPNFVVAQNGNAVNFTWTQVADFALKGYDIGYAAQGTAVWSEFNLLTEASKGTEMTNAAVPSGTWTFGIVARDVADQIGPLATFDLVVQNNNDTTTVQVQEPDWAGSMSGFIRHWTGVLVPDSTTLANHTSDFTIFDNFVVDPVASCTYTTSTYDIGFANSLRIHWAYDITPGPGQASGATATAGLDAWTSGTDPGTYQPWTVGTVPVRYLNMQLTYNPVAGQVGYVDDFTYTVDRSPLIEQLQDEVIAAGGSMITFDQPFHVVPKVESSVQGTSPLYATVAAISTTGCTIHVWDHNGNDVGGTVTLRATGY